jgi:hypothetical protein
MVSLLILLKIYYILNPNLSGLLEPQEDESTTVKTERLKREKKYSVLLKIYSEYSD